ncbi:hypothetical protein [Ruminiclostridium cellulolyticum]|uniref:Uncharacterized protein n=1 Tax=Ruminiclostridium cellulolyticum (strain ATCC 35319 / DSM 5812 / JCM 6584 / H10) TaxID=394503 RepID=B8I8E0_RUMCH|nr:hypothetical protein [Ruminiclostridium cellulolyticum]ACL77240.1 hypothetical protein Ccel_2946 [Ruminiclostridium cellulolyticum H10]
MKKHGKKRNSSAKDCKGDEDMNNVLYLSQHKKEQRSFDFLRMFVDSKYRKEMYKHLDKDYVESKEERAIFDEWDEYQRREDD